MENKSSRYPAADKARPERAGAESLEGLPVHAGELVETDIVGLNEDGEGVGRVNGFTLFIDGALPGEMVMAKVEQVKKNYGHARTVRILKQSPDRIKPACPIHDACGGCQLQHLSYDAQLLQKQKIVADALERIGKFAVNVADKKDGGSSSSEAGRPARALTQKEPVLVHPTLGMDDPWRYRNKAQVPFGQREGALVGGFYAKGTHEIIEFDVCAIQHEQNDAVVNTVKRIARELHISGYDAGAGRGILRHVIAKVGVRTGEIMIVFVTNGSFLPARDTLVAQIRRQIPGVTSIVQNINQGRTSMVMGDNTRVLWGKSVIHDFIGDVKFAISAQSFYQVNPSQTEVLYGKALEYAALTGSETVIDAYCGIGTISLFLARHANHVYGVEIVPAAIDDARVNAELNGIRNVDFAVGKAEDVLPAWKRKGIVADVIVVDPPRRGCDPALLKTMLAMKPARIVYVSCDPATLARDLRVLGDGGYRVVEAQPVDMFPHTVHVETVVKMVLKGRVT